MTPDDAFPVGKFVRVAGGRFRLHYHELGSPNAKPTILFLHGSGPGASGYSNFRQNYPAFAQAGYHVLLVDYIGFGHSDKPTDFVYSTENQVAILHEVLLQVGATRTVPVGNSLGGFYGIAYALAYPSEVPRMILMAPGGIHEECTKPTSPGLKAMSEAVAARNFTEENFRKLLRMLVHDERHITDQVVAERLPIAQTQPLEVYSKAVHAPVWERLGELKMPVLGFWGAHDQFLSVRHALIMLEKIEDCRVTISNRAGHWFMIEEATLFNEQCASFLREAG
jgi:4,5:9,10-diseco-3-hydroxy-5,9,17-trioxoandrosta-1(10),2-diene-4-oate hydrolase